MGRTPTTACVAVVLCTALVNVGAQASAFGDEPTQAPKGDTITPLVRAATRAPEISPSRGHFWFYVGSAMSVSHTLTYQGRVLGRQTVRCPRAGTWRVRITFSSFGRQTLRRLLGNHQSDRLTWRMLATDERNTQAARTVTLRR